MHWIALFTFTNAAAFSASVTGTENYETLHTDTLLALAYNILAIEIQSMIKILPIYYT